MPPVLRGPMSRSLGQRRSTVSPRDCADRLRRRQARSERKQRESRGRHREPQQHADVKSVARRRVPGVIAAAPAGSLLIGKEDRTVRAPLRAAASASLLVEPVTGAKMQLAGEDGAGERGFESGEIEHGLARLRDDASWRCRPPWPSGSARPR